MKTHKTITALLALFSFTTILAVSQNASASSIPIGHERWVTLTRNVKVYKYHLAIPMSDSYSVGSYTAKKGSHFKLQHSGVNFEWTFNSGRFNSNSYYVYAVSAKGSNWFKMGIHHVSNYKSFHGYRIEGRKSLYNFNTFYDKPDHATISDYRPTQKSKVIFEYGSHVYPTKHEWDWMHGKWMTGYKYKNGAWKQISNDKIPE